MSNHFKITALSLLLLLLAACTGIPQSTYKQPLKIPEDAYPAPMMFSTLSFAIEAGSDVGTVSDFENIPWIIVPANRDLIRAGISQQMLKNTFETALEGLGYDVVNQNSQSFIEEIEDEMLRSEYRIAGKIIDAKIDANLDDHTTFKLFVTGKSGIKGDLYLKIKWSIFDALRRTTVYQTTTEGTGAQAYADPEGLALMVNAAFEMAVHNLGADPVFYDLIINGIKPAGWPKHKKHEDRPLKFDANEAVTIKNPPLSTTPFSQISDQASKAAILVQGGSAGHGSGYFITDQGHIITNQHVVGNAQRVRIVTSGKKDKLIAQILRIDRARDVALLKLEDKPDDLNITTLPIRTQRPTISENIYAIGAPLQTRLQDTISKGIVSAHRPNYKILGTRQDFIQSDVSIHGGNSGGPLLDEFGNILGMSVAGISGSGSSNESLNFFIPIDDVLEKLKIEITNK